MKRCSASQRLRARHRPGEAVELAGVGGEALLDQRDHLARDRVGRERRARRHGAGAGGAEGLAVVGVEVPLAALGLARSPSISTPWRLRISR